MYGVPHPYFVTCAVAPLSIQDLEAYSLHRLAPPDVSSSARFFLAEYISKKN